jgi:hypothetical protein
VIFPIAIPVNRMVHSRLIYGNEPILNVGPQKPDYPRRGCRIRGLTCGNVTRLGFFREQQELQGEPAVNTAARTTRAHQAGVGERRKPRRQPEPVSRADQPADYGDGTHAGAAARGSQPHNLPDPR